MKIRFLKISGFGPFKDEIEIDFNVLDLLVAIVGNNGSGKTFFMELFFAILFADFPFRTIGNYKSMYDQIYSDDFYTAERASIEMVFEMPGGVRYRILRNFVKRGKTQEHSAYVFQADACLAETVNSANEWVEKNVCEKSIFLASVFNSQNSAGDLVDCGADARKEIFARLIGLGDLQEKSKRYYGIATAVEGKTLELKRERDNVAARAGDIENLNREIEKTKAAIFETNFQLEDKKQILENLIDEHARYREIAGQLSQKEAEINRLQNDTSLLLKRKSDIEEKLLDLEALENAAAELPTLQEKEKALQADVTELARLRAEEQKIIGQGKTLKAEIEAANKERQSEIDKLRNCFEEKAELSKIDIELSKLDRAKKETAILPGLNCEKNCEYVKNAVDAEAWLQENTKQEGELRKKKNALKIIIDENLNCAKRLSADPADPIKNAELEKLRNEIKEIQKSIVAHGQAEYFLSELRTKITAFQQAATRRAELSGISEQLPELEKSIAGLTDRAERAQAEAKALRDKNTVPASLDALRNEIGALENIVGQVNTRLGTLQQQISDATKSRLQLGIIENKIKKHERLQMGYDRLALAFSRNGLQALIIDSEKQNFLDIARPLLRMLSNDELELNFTTIKKIKSGKERETFDMLIHAGGGWREVKMCSKAQQDISRIAIRCALAIYHAQKGNRIETLFLDEFTGSFDANYRANIIPFLHYMNQHFKQIFVISHQDVAREIPCKILVENGRVQIV